MLETLLKLYVMAMAGDVRTPVPHLVGPPGCGKSTFAQQLADLVSTPDKQVRLHTINVSRISPLELEGVQMPDKEHARLNLLTATYWSSLRDGDIVLLDEFLRGFPEVYNGLLDILTSREVAGFKLPRVFFVAASNSTVSYDKALEDRLIHLPVPDPRTSKREKKRLGEIFVDALGILPSIATSFEMERMLDHEVLPTYELLDALKQHKTMGTASIKGASLRNLIGQAKLRHIMSAYLQEVIDMNNRRAIQEGKFQYVFLTTGKAVDARYAAAVPQLLKSPKLTEGQRLNLTLNLQLIQLEEAKQQGKETVTDEDIFAD